MREKLPRVTEEKQVTKIRNSILHALYPATRVGGQERRENIEGEEELSSVRGDVAKVTGALQKCGVGWKLPAFQTSSLQLPDFQLPTSLFLLPDFQLPTSISLLPDFQLPSFYFQV